MLAAENLGRRGARMSPAGRIERSSSVLALTRKKGEVVELHVPGLAEPIQIVVVDGRSKLAFKAPRSVAIMRGEAKQREAKNTDDRR
jgi:sRNA-binding carbon storage regulator CsrA